MTPGTLLAAATAQGGKHSAKVTDWTDRIGWIVGLLLVVGLVYWLMRQGWQWRRTLQGGLPALPAIPERPGPALLEFDGRYHGSTTAGRWLDRIVAHGLGVRSKVRLSLTEEGLVVDRVGAPGFLVPAAALRGARLDRAIAGKVLPEGGLLVVTWEHGGTLVDSGFRSDHAADHPRWVARINELDGPGSPGSPGALGSPDAPHADDAPDGHRGPDGPGGRRAAAAATGPDGRQRTATPAPRSPRHDKEGAQ